MVQKSLNVKGLNPAVAELRAQRLVYAKLSAALGLPSGVEEAMAGPKPRTRATKFSVVNGGQA